MKTVMGLMASLSICVVLGGCSISGVPMDKWVLCYEPGSVKPTNDPVLTWVQALDAQEKGCTKDAVALLESSLEKLYMAEDIYLPHISMTELLLAEALEALGETSRAVACRMIGYQHAVIREARTPGANAPDSIRVPYGHEQRNREDPGR